MEPNIEVRLQAIEAKITETYDIVKKIRNSQKNAMYMRLAYWAVLVLAALGAFYFIKPYLELLTGAYGVVQQGSQSGVIQNLLEQVKDFEGL